MTTKVGVYVRCSTCGHQKRPRGRSAPLLLTMCEPSFPGLDDGCDGYNKPPLVGDLWPGETDEDFGYPCSDAGTKPIEEAADV